MQELNKKNLRTWSMLGQRGTVCGIALPEIMEQKNNIYVMTADLMHLSGLERVRNKFPEKFINVGIAEQNMIGVAAGLASEGNIVFATTYATFLTMRCYEQIRHHMGYQKMNIKLIGSSAGVQMGMSGNTHYTYEDIAIMRAIPNMTILSPADASQAYLSIFQALQIDGPVYIRLTGGLNESIIYTYDTELKISYADILKEGDDVAIISTGNIIKQVIDAAQLLEKEGLHVSVIDMHTIKPLDDDILKKQMRKRLIITVEEHSVIGGLGSAVCEYFAQNESHPPIRMIGINDKFLHPASSEKLKKDTGLTAEGIYERVRKEYASVC